VTTKASKSTCPGMWASSGQGGATTAHTTPATHNMEVLRCKGYFVRSSRIFAISIAVLGLATTSPAIAANPARDGYLTTPINVPPTVQGASSTTTKVATVTPTKSTGSSLPFTGLDIGLVAGAAVLLLGLGFALRRGTRTES